MRHDSVAGAKDITTAISDCDTIVRCAHEKRKHAVKHHEIRL